MYFKIGKDFTFEPTVMMSKMAIVSENMFANSRLGILEW
jgi:hypothetical protein